MNAAANICKFIGLEPRGLKRVVITLDSYSGHKVECEYFLLPPQKNAAGELETVVRNFELKELIDK